MKMGLEAMIAKVCRLMQFMLKNLLPKWIKMLYMYSFLSANWRPIGVVKKTLRYSKTDLWGLGSN